MSRTMGTSKSTMIDYAGSSSGYINLFSYSHNHNQGGYHETLVEVLVNEAAILYEKMVKDFTNQTITNVAADSSTNVLPSTIYLDEQPGHTQASFVYRHITQTPVYE
jgi:hypothetical protein